MDGARPADDHPSQYKRLGASLDYRRERFTMDDDYARAVLEVFVRLLPQGLPVPRQPHGELVPGAARPRSPTSRWSTARSRTSLYAIDYPLEGGGHVTVATVRPATMLGDTGVAVQPERRALPRPGRPARRSCRSPSAAGADHGRRATSTSTFGTGALKMTPGHDPNDFEIGRRHGLAEIAVIGFDGHMTDEAGERYAGLTVAERREAAWLEDLRERGLIAPRAAATCTRSGHCQRSGARVEPLVSLQWFCRMDELAAPAIAAVRERARRASTRRAPSASSSTGWRRSGPGASRASSGGATSCRSGTARATTSSSRSRADQLPECGGCELERDPDVLDTWFSSALWPFATLGWPDDTPELRTLLPEHVLSTAREIINLWVRADDDDGHRVPRRASRSPTSYIHSTIQAADGRRMSKSLGTGIDPLELIDRYGADATRYGLLKMCSTQDVRFAEGMIDEGRGLANKLWNAVAADPAGRRPTSRRRRLVREPVDALDADAARPGDRGGRRRRSTRTTSRAASRRSTASSGTT